MKRNMILTEQQIINAIKNVISEARRNPETNVDENFDEFFNRMIQKAPRENIFISFREDIHVTDVNPVNKYRTPTGYYSYPLSSFNIDEKPSEVGFRRSFPFGNHREYINFFILKNHDGILTGKTDKSTLDMYVERIKKLYPTMDKIGNLCDLFIGNKYTSDYIKKTPVHVTHLFWLFLYDIANTIQVENTQNRINLICRKIGVNGFVDYEGYEYIHSAEPEQAVFFKVKNLGEVFIYEKPKLSIKNAIQSKDFIVVKQLENDAKVIKLNNEYALIDNNGELISKHLFDDVFEFKNGFAEVVIKSRCNLIDKNGNLISKKWFNWIDGFESGVAKVGLKGKYNFINQNGELQSKQWFDIIYGFKHGIAKVQIKDKCNLIKQNGELLSPNKWFDWAGSFQDGFAAVNLGGKWNLFKQNGELISPNQWFDNIGEFNRGIARVELNGKSNLINRDGELSSPNKWVDEIIGYTNSFARVKIQGQTYMLDINDGSISEVK